MSSVPRFDEIAKRVHDQLEEGDRLSLEMRDGEVRVSSGKHAPVLPTDLRGKLLVCESRLAGSGAAFFAWIAGALVAIGIIWGNPKEVIGIDLRGFQTFWIYGGIIIGAFAGFNRQYQQRIGREYEVVGKDIRQAILTAGMTPFEVITLIEKETQLSNVRQALSNDPAIVREC